MSIKYTDSSFVYATSESTYRFVSSIQHNLRLAIKINASEKSYVRSNNRYLEEDLKSEGTFFKVNPQLKRGDPGLKLFLFEDFKENEFRVKSNFYEGMWFENIVRPIFFKGGFDKIMQGTNLEFLGDSRNNKYLPLKNISSHKEELTILRRTFENNQDTNLYEFLDYCYSICE
ncbi:TPA: hypothetical protein LWO28_002664 [Listeria innocua]|nr:hypothetical protein [Listeria innocua]HBM4183218.1 hypothetical protein [Listeria innocua]HBM4282999.1 hypothetical protein [Listeria innocua]HBM4574450.1 hypothetical protein [Listeria innocua]